MLMCLQLFQEVFYIYLENYQNINTMCLYVVTINIKKDAELWRGQTTKHW